MFNQIVEAIHETAMPKYRYVIGNHFTEQSQLFLEDFSTFLCFKEGRILQSDIESFYEIYKPGLEPVSRQFISSQRKFIDPQLFKDINQTYLKKMDYQNNIRLIRFMGFFLLSGDGSDFELPDFPNIREEFNIVSTPKYTKPCMGKFSAIMNDLNGILLTGILGNYKRRKITINATKLN